MDTDAHELHNQHFQLPVRSPTHHRAADPIRDDQHAGTQHQGLGVADAMASGHP
jgi:hypothetical protein